MINNNKSKWHTRTPTHGLAILVPRGRAPICQHQESRLLVWSNDIPVFNGFVNTIDWDQNQSDLRRVTGSPWIRCWTWPEVAILGADQKERGLWGRECGLASTLRMCKAMSPGMCQLYRQLFWLTRPNQLSMVATARVIWLCACVRFWQIVGWCLSVSLAFNVELYDGWLVKNNNTKKCLFVSLFAF